MSDTVSPYRITDYQTDAAPSAAPSSAGRTAFTEEELAKFCASLTAYGVPSEALDNYTREYIAGLKQPLELLGVSEALADWGICRNADGGVPLPAPARVALGAGMAALVTLGMRRKYALQPSVDHRAAGAPGHSAGAQEFYE